MAAESWVETVMSSMMVTTPEHPDGCAEHSGESLVPLTHKIQRRGHDQRRRWVSAMANSATNVLPEPVGSNTAPRRPALCQASTASRW